MAGLLDILNMATGKQGFIDNELPKIANSFYQARTGEDIERAGVALIGAAQKAGYGPKNVELLLDKMQGPALARLEGGELDRIAQRFKPHDTYIDEKKPNFQVVPEGEGTTESPQMQGLAGMMPGQPQTVPGKEFDQGDAMDIAATRARYGGKGPSAGLAGMMTAPSMTTENLAQAGAADALAAQRQREEQFRKSQQETLENLPDDKDPETGLSPRDIGVGERGTTGLASMWNNRANNAAQAPLRQSGVNLNRARVGTEGARQGELGTRSTANDALAERRRRPGGTDADGNPIETVTETDRNVKPEQQLVAERVIARTAIDRGAKTPEDIAQIADDLGYELEGDVALEGSEGYFGTSIGAGTPKLTGNFRLRPKASRKTTTKGKVAPGDRPAAAPVARAQPKPAGKRKSLDEIWGTSVK